MKQYGSSIHYMKKTIELYHPPAQLMASIYRQLAFNYYLTGAWMKSFESYKEALAPDPDKMEVIFHMGELCDFKLNEKKKAIYYYQRVVDMSHSNPAAYEGGKNDAVPISVVAWRRINTL